MVDQISNVKWFYERFRAEVELIGEKEMLAMMGWEKNPRQINRIIDQERVDPRLIARYAYEHGMSISEMLLTPGTKTDWYTDCKVDYFPRNYLNAVEESGITSADLARKAGIKDSTVRNIKFNYTIPYSDNLQKIADALEMEVADLFLPPEG